jgi:hypothetical protein
MNHSINIAIQANKTASVCVEEQLGEKLVNLPAIYGEDF